MWWTVHSSSIPVSAGGPVLKQMSATYSSTSSRPRSVGAGVTDAMGRQAPEGLLGIHTNLLVTALGGPASLPRDTEQERAALEAIKTFQASGNGYFVEQATRP